jgi:hypothetical protein
MMVVATHIANVQNTRVNGNDMSLASYTSLTATWLHITSSTSGRWSPWLTLFGDSEVEVCALRAAYRDVVGPTSVTHTRRKAFAALDSLCTVHKELQ